MSSLHIEGAYLGGEGTLAGQVGGADGQNTPLVGEQMHYRQLLGELERSWKGLADKPEETPSTILRALWFTAAGQPCSCKMAAAGELPFLLDHQRVRLGELLELRRRGVPVAHLTRRQDFMGIELHVGPEALIPRKETEILARAAINKICELGKAGLVRVIDVCTGCGNLALAYASHASNCIVYGADLSSQAVELARRNAVHLVLDEQVEFRCGDLLCPFEESRFVGQVGLITCNPPYISSGKLSRLPSEIVDHEPGLAFDGGPFGLSVIIRLLSQSLRYLKPGGWLGLEVGAGQGQSLARHLKAMGGYSDIQLHSDGAGDVRAILARKEGAPEAGAPDLSCD